MGREIDSLTVIIHALGTHGVDGPYPGISELSFDSVRAPEWSL